MIAREYHWLPTAGTYVFSNERLGLLAVGSYVVKMRMVRLRFLPQCSAISLSEAKLVRLSRFDGSEFYINADLIEIIEMTPDTVISLTNGRKFVVRQSADEVVSLVVDYKRRVAWPEMACHDEGHRG